MSTLKSVESPTSAPGADDDASARIVALNPEAITKLTKSMGPVIGPIMTVSITGLLSLQVYPNLEKTIATVAIVIATIVGIIYIRQKNLQ
jgi:hypothetical protein